VWLVMLHAKKNIKQKKNEKKIRRRDSWCWVSRTKKKRKNNNKNNISAAGRRRDLWCCIQRKTKIKKIKKSALGRDSWCCIEVLYKDKLFYYVSMLYSI
jgi:hypothetical protein